MQRATLLKSNHNLPHTGVDYIDAQRKLRDEWDLNIYFHENNLPKGITPAHIRISPMGDAAGAPLSVVSVTYDKTMLIVHIKEQWGSNIYIDKGQTHGYFLEFVHTPGIDIVLAGAPFILGALPPSNPQPLADLNEWSPPVTPIDYLCKDYASFRRLILDHLSLLAPHWEERHIPDPGITLVEIMAYAADYLSYYQDAAATEAYLGTARRRISLRRHARLLDYFVRQGCNSRVLVHVQVNENTSLEKGTVLLTGVPGQSGRISTQYYRDLVRDDHPNIRVFETMHHAALFPEHNRMNIYDWAPSGNTQENDITTIELEGHFPHLKAGDVLIIEMANPEDPAAARYHPVRLTQKPTLSYDLLKSNEITCITWAHEDALPGFIPESAGKGCEQELISVLGNIVPADYGRTITGEVLPQVPEKGRYYPRLHSFNLIFSAPYTDPGSNTNPGQTIKNMLKQDPGHALAAVELEEYPGYLTDNEMAGKPAPIARWTVCRDLLKSGPFDRHFVVETEQDGGIFLRFGDGKLGKKPAPGARFKVFYRSGYGPAGGVEPGAINHIVTDNSCITGVFNPQAGTNYNWPESTAQVRRDAPQEFKNQQRCITMADYVRIAQSHPEVTKAHAQSDWTGSWRTTFLYVDRKDGRPVDLAFKHEMTAFMEPYRPSGSDLEIRPPYFVPLYIALTVYTDCGIPSYLLLEELQKTFSNVRFPDGSCGFFHPDNFTFGQPLYLSAVVARAMNTSWVNRVETQKFQRMDTPLNHKISPKCIQVGPLEIIRLDNDPMAPANGIITFTIKYANTKIRRSDNE